MTTVNDIFSYLSTLAPLELQMGFDNSGFLFGRDCAEIKKVLLALDVTSTVVEEAIEKGVQLIVTHHPVIFRPLKSMTDDKLLRLAENSIAVISMHTNLDIAQGGVNDVLIELLGAKGTQALDEDGCGRIGELPDELCMSDFLVRCKDKLNSKGLRYYDAGRQVKKLAVMGGSGGDFVKLAFDYGCDTYVTADIKYNQFLDAAELGINLIDADHYCTENPVMPVLKDKLDTQFPDIVFELSSRHEQVVSFF